MKKQRFYQITQADRTADINIYGDITSWEWLDSDVSAHSIKTDIDSLDVDEINVYINSYGGEVAEAVAIYSALQRHRAKVHTFVDGFACSAASIIFCAGDVRTVSSIGLLMIHNCMSYLGFANSNEMRKAAEDNDKINQSSIEAYKKVSGLSEEQIKEMMDNETWLTAAECLEYGFATDIANDDEEDELTEQSAFKIVREAVLNRNVHTAEPDERLVHIEEMCKSLIEFAAAQAADGDPDDEDDDDQNDDDQNDDDQNDDADDGDQKDEEKTKEQQFSKALNFFKALGGK